MAERKQTPNNRLSDLDNPTAAFPIGALQRGTLRAKPAVRPSAGDEDETERRPMSRIPIHGSDDDEEDYDSRSFVLPPAVEPYDPRWIALALLVTVGLAAAAAVLAAAFVMMA